MDKQAEQMAGFVRARDVARLVLYPDRRRGLKAAGQIRAVIEGRHDKAVPVDTGHLFVEVSDELDEVLIGHAVGGGEVIRVQQRPPTHERIGFRALERELHLVGVEHPTKHVIGAVAGAGTTERVRLRGVDDRATAPADDRARELVRGTR